LGDRDRRVKSCPKGKEIKLKMAEGLDQEVENLLSKCKALSSSPSPAINK
jgi:hypothetical protein